MRKLCIDPYTPEELKDALRKMDTHDPIVSWTGEYGIMNRALEYIEELEAKLDKIVQVIEE